MPQRSVQKSPGSRMEQRACPFLMNKQTGVKGGRRLGRIRWI